MTAATDVIAKERRRHRRATVMVPAFLDQYPVTVTDLSLGGLGAGQLEMMIDGELGPKRGDRASLRFVGQDNPEECIEVEILRISTQRGSLGARYVSLTPEQESLLKELLSKHSQV